MIVFSVPKGEKGRLHVFELDPGSFPEETSEQDVARAFGHAIDPKYIFVADMAALKEIGLTGFMTEGLHARMADLEADKAKLNALSGHVAVILSEAFHGAGFDGEVPGSVRYVGSYGEHRIATTAEDIETDSAAGQIRPKAPAPGRLSRQAVIVIIALCAMALLPLIFILFGGAR
ncbi:MAG: hypothetical protein AAGF74_04225 [Pseudomonadota bacterium]